VSMVAFPPNEGNEWKFDIVLKDYTSLVTFLSIMSKIDSA